MGKGKSKEGEKYFEIFYNALSVGWHLRKIMEIDDGFIGDNYEKFAGWLSRHNIKGV